MTIIRQVGVITRARRIGGEVSSLEGVALSQPAEAEAAEAMKARLRREFAHELDTIAAEVRREADLEAEKVLQEHLSRLESEAALALEKERTRLSAEHGKQMDALLGLMKGLESAVDALRGEMTTTAVATAYSAVVRLLGEKHANGELIALMVKQAIREHDIHGAVEVFMSEPDIRRFDAAGIDVPVMLRLSDSMRPGQCRIKHAGATIEVDAAHQLEVVKQTFLQALGTADDAGA